MLPEPATPRVTPMMRYWRRRSQLAAVSDRPGPLRAAVGLRTRTAFARAGEHPREVVGDSGKSNPEARQPEHCRPRSGLAGVLAMTISQSFAQGSVVPVRRFGPWFLAVRSSAARDSNPSRRIRSFR